jgi:hypothetical protein
LETKWKEPCVPRLPTVRCRRRRLHFYLIDRTAALQQLQPTNRGEDKNETTDRELDSRIVSVCVWSHPLGRTAHMMYSLLKPMEHHGDFYYNAMELPPELEDRRGPLVPPHHFFITCRTEEGQWFMVGKDVNGLEWGNSRRKDDGSNLPYCMIQRYEAKATARIKEEKEAFQNNAGCSLLRYFKDQGAISQEGNAPKSEQMKRNVTVGQLLAYARDHPEEVGRVPFLGPEGLLLLLGIKCDREEEMKGKIEKYLFNTCHSFVRDVMCHCFGIRFGHNEHFEDGNVKNELSFRL